MKRWSSTRRTACPIPNLAIVVSRLIRARRYGGSRARAIGPDDAAEGEDSVRDPVHEALPTLRPERAAHLVRLREAVEWADRGAIDDADARLGAQDHRRGIG